MHNYLFIIIWLQKIADKAQGIPELSPIFVEAKINNLSVNKKIKDQYTNCLKKGFQRGQPRQNIKMKIIKIC
jgi:hypothetical protein